MAAQSSVGWETRGVVTGTNMFARSVGSAVGIAVFGAIANAAVAGRGVDVTGSLEHVPAPVLSPAIHDVFDAERVEDKKARNPKKALPSRAGPFHWGE